MNQVRYLESAGKLAETEGHRAEAVSLYTKAIATAFDARYVDPKVMKRARALWDEQGGTQDGWEIATTRLPAPNPKPPARTPPRVANGFAAWEKAATALPETSLQDSLGNTWSVSSLKGKTTFLNVWATWCGRCREELPQVQKLYDLSKRRGDFQVLTFSVDENPGELEPFLKENGYTFPVVLARKYVESVVGPYLVPQNWLREKSVGFDSKIADWPKDMAARVALIGN